MAPNISIVMTSYNRNEQLWRTLGSFWPQNVDDLEVIVVDDSTEEPWPMNMDEVDRYIRLNRHTSATFLNPSYPVNVGIRASKGSIIILQNAECKHIDPNTIAKLTALVTPTNAVFARVIALNQDGSERELYCGIDRPRPYFFCGAICREWFEKLRGFDEEFDGYGWEDDDFSDRLRRECVQFVFTDILVHHQWHPSYEGNLEPGRIMFERKQSEPTVRNIGREWGEL